jgi:quercetin dioxygenase-like cupin family protein
MRYEVHQVAPPDAPLETFLAGVRGVEQPELLPLMRAMRAMIPVEGDDWVKAITVAIEPYQTNHQGQQAHSHEEWTAVYYHMPAGVPIVIDDVAVVPAPGEVFVLPPGLEHRVAANSQDRLRVSFAILVPEAGAHSKFSR